MIICSCHVLSDRDVAEVVDAGGPAPTAMQVYGCLGCAPECGRCARTIRQIIAQIGDRESGDPR
jgi:bacterioferritin-associated ferredoxin